MRNLSTEKLSGTRIGVLASGGLGLTSLVAVSQSRELAFVLTDRQSTEIRNFCDTQSVDCFVGNPRAGRVTSFLKDHPCDVILSLNYLFLVDDDVLSHPSRYAINFHGSLLPRYRGRTPHVWAIINNETETGISAHLMQSGCDTGDIVWQHRIAIPKEATGADLLRQFHDVYPRMIDDILMRIDEGTLDPRPQDHSKATSFGKRTPADGTIDWRWYRERIYNWIRAQAAPYPGAFFTYDSVHYHVHASRFSDLGFDGSDPDGTVLCLDPLVVKTTNGALELMNHTLPVQQLQMATSPIVLT